MTTVTEELDALLNGQRYTGAGLKVIRLADVEPTAIDWLWPNRIARGKVTLIAGDPGLGKSIITSALAATVSTGGRWPDRSGTAPLGNVIMLSAEDAADDTIRPRLDAAGADVDRTFCVEAAEEIDERGEKLTRSFSLESDVERLAKLIGDIGNVPLVTIDPVSAYIGMTDSHKNADVRRLLMPLADLAEQYKVAIVAVTHLNKGSGSAVYRSIGSIAFIAAARAAWAVTKDKDNSGRRLILPIKNNLGTDETGLAYEIRTADNGAPVLAWEPDPISIDVDDALGQSGDTGSALDDAVQWLASELNSGPVLQSDIRTHAAREGHAWGTVRRAKDQLEVRAVKDSGRHGKWRWCLPEDARPHNVITLSTLPEASAIQSFQEDAQDAHSAGQEHDEQVTCPRCAGEGCDWCGDSGRYPGHL